MNTFLDLVVQWVIPGAIVAIIVIAAITVVEEFSEDRKTRKQLHRARRLSDARKAQAAAFDKALSQKEPDQCHQ